jgi:hypothetical protein
MLQSAVGIDPAHRSPLRKAGKSPLHRELLQTRIDELKSRIRVGGAREGAVRALLYAGMGRASVDERGFEAVRRIRGTQDTMKRPTLAEFKALVRDQYFMLLLDPDAAVAALPDLLPDADERRKVLTAVRGVLSVRGEIDGDVADRLQRMARVLGVEAKLMSIAAPGAAAGRVRAEAKAS